MSTSLPQTGAVAVGAEQGIAPESLDELAAMAGLRITNRTEIKMRILFMLETGFY
jgi:hypothetical protein